MPEFYITGVAESPLGHVIDQSESSMAALAAMEALDEAGLTRADVDGLFVNYMGEEGSVQVGEYLGIEPSHADSSDLGGGSWVGFIGHAMAAIAAGQCEVALLVYASRQRALRKRSREYPVAPPAPSRSPRSSTCRPESRRPSAISPSSRRATCTSTGRPRSSSPRSRSPDGNGRA